MIFKAVRDGRPYPEHGLTTEAVGRDPAAPGAARPADHHQARAGARQAARRGLHLLRRPVPARRAVGGRALPGGRRCTGRCVRRCSSATRSTPGCWCSPSRSSDDPVSRATGPSLGWRHDRCRWTCSTSTRCSARRSWQIRDVVRQLVDDHVRPHVADWYEDGRVPARELAKRVRRARPARHAPDRLRLRRRLGGRLRAGLPGAGGRRLGRPQPGQRAGLAGHVRDLALRLARSRSSAGCRRWPPARRSAASA